MKKLNKKLLIGLLMIFSFYLILFTLLFMIKGRAFNLFELLEATFIPLLIFFITMNEKKSQEKNVQSKNDKEGMKIHAYKIGSKYLQI